MKHRQRMMLRAQVRPITLRERRTQRQDLLHNIIVVKFTVMVGLGIAVVVPHEWQPVAALSANFLWLWRT